MLAMVIVGRAKYTYSCAREITRRRDARGVPKIISARLLATRLLVGGDFRDRVFISPESPKLEITCSLILRLSPLTERVGLSPFRPNFRFEIKM